MKIGDEVTIDGKTYEVVDIDRKSFDSVKLAHDGESYWTLRSEIEKYLPEVETSLIYKLTNMTTGESKMVELTAKQFAELNHFLRDGLFYVDKV